MSQIIASDLNLEKITEIEDIKNNQCYLYEYDENIYKYDENRVVGRRLDFIGYFMLGNIYSSSSYGSFIIVWWREARHPNRPNEKLTKWNYFNDSKPSDWIKGNILYILDELVDDIDNKNYNDINFYSLGDKLGRFLFTFKDERPDPDFFIPYDNNPNKIQNAEQRLTMVSNLDTAEQRLTMVSNLDTAEAKLEVKEFIQDAIKKTMEDPAKKTTASDVLDRLDSKTHYIYFNQRESKYYICNLKQINKNKKLMDTSLIELKKTLENKLESSKESLEKNRIKFYITEKIKIIEKHLAKIKNKKKICSFSINI
jgi:hypothetical protein